MSLEWRLGRASPADLAALLEIERACPEASHWSEAAWRDILQQVEKAEAARAVFVAESEGHLSGFAVIQHVAGSAELENLAVRPANRRRGVAAALCHHAVAWASAQAAEWSALPGEQRSASQLGSAIHLEVRAGNLAALQLYAGLGFIEQGRRTSYYEHPVEDAVLMTRALARPS